MKLVLKTLWSEKALAWLSVLHPQTASILIGATFGVKRAQVSYDPIE